MPRRDFLKTSLTTIDLASCSITALNSSANVSTKSKLKVLGNEIAFVDPGAIFPMPQAECLKSSFQSLETVYLGKGGHFLQEDYPKEIGEALLDWLQQI